MASKIGWNLLSLKWNFTQHNFSNWLQLWISTHWLSAFFRLIDLSEDKLLHLLLFHCQSVHSLIETERDRKSKQRWGCDGGSDEWAEWWTIEIIRRQEGRVICWETEWEKYWLHEENKLVLAPLWVYMVTSVITVFSQDICCTFSCSRFVFWPKKKKSL